jgi:hypothetical protein
MSVHLLKYWLLLTAVIVTQFSAISLALADESLLKDGKTAIVSGKLFLAKGQDIQERKVTYPAIRLDVPVTVADEVEKFSDIRVMRILLDDSKQKSLRLLLGKRVQISGTVLFRWYGPSSAPNPAMLIVQKLKAIRE